MNIRGELVTNSDSTLYLQKTLEKHTSHLLPVCTDVRGEGREGNWAGSGNHKRDFHRLLILEPYKCKTIQKKILRTIKCGFPDPLEIGRSDVFTPQGILKLGGLWTRFRKTSLCFSIIYKVESKHLNSCSSREK